MKFLILILIFITGCSAGNCPCSCGKCGVDCRNKCDGDRCYPGVKCCDDCNCHKKPSLKISVPKFL